MVLAGLGTAGSNEYSVRSVHSISSSSSSSSCDSYSDHSSTERHGGLTLQDEFNEAAVYHSTEWEVSGEGESCAEEDSDAGNPKEQGRVEREERLRGVQKDPRQKDRGAQLPKVSSQPPPLQRNSTRSPSVQLRGSSGSQLPLSHSRASQNSLPKVYDSQGSASSKKGETTLTPLPTKKKRRRRRSPETELCGVQRRKPKKHRTSSNQKSAAGMRKEPCSSDVESYTDAGVKLAGSFLDGAGTSTRAGIAEDPKEIEPSRRKSAPNTVSETPRYKFRLWRRSSATTKTKDKRELEKERKPAVTLGPSSSKRSASFFATTKAIRNVLRGSKRPSLEESLDSDLESLDKDQDQAHGVDSRESSRPGTANHSRTWSLGGSVTDVEGLRAEDFVTSFCDDDGIHRPLSICTANCRYDVVRRVSKRFGMKDVSEDEPWNLYWTDLSISLERCKDMKRFQKINHFPGMAEICRKDLLARNLNRMLRLFPKDYNFFPKTWCLPADLGDLCTYARTRRNRTYILKPDTGCQGKGIYLTRSVRDLKPHTRMICQVYISRPFLVDGFKFDMRVYTLVTSCDPLRVFVYNDGLVRFATSQYHEPSSHNTANVFMHLTNYAVNKHSRTFVVDDEAGSKRKISTLNKWLESKNYDVVDIWARIDELIVKTLIAALPVIRHNYHACFPAHDFTYACFELLGFDILLDHKLKPYILEVNHSPSFHTDAQIDREVKENLLSDTFGILNLSQYDKRKVMEEDRRRVRDRLLQSIAHKEGSDCSMASSDNNPWKAQFEWEDNNLGNYRRIYPCEAGLPDKYEAFFHQNQSSLFQETAASRAREEASRLQRDMYEVKQKEEEARRPMSLARGRKEYERLRPESPLVGRRTRNTAPKLKRNTVQAAVGGKKAVASKTVLNSFLPETICESEESIRAAALAERSVLIQSKGIVQMVRDQHYALPIYQMLKENKSLCAEDLRKYAGLDVDGAIVSLSAPGAHTSIRKDDDRDLLSQTGNKLPSLLTLIQKTTGPQLEVNKTNNMMAYENLVATNVARGGGEPMGILPQGTVIPGLGVVCAEAPFWVRPGPALWTSHAQLAHLSQASLKPMAVPRINRSTMGRLVSNSLKLHNIEKRQAAKPQAL